MSNHQFNHHAGNYEQSGVQDHVSIHIWNMLRSIPPNSPEHSIFRVPHQLRKVNEKAYEPEILAIGPYHHGNDKFKFMEEQKMRYMQQLLQRKDERSVDRYVPTLRELEQPARNCYAETIDVSQEKFLAMMLLDGCFIIELFRKHIKNELIDDDDPIVWSGGILGSIRRDLLLLENQLPLFVLSKLYDLTKGPDEPLQLSDVAIKYFQFEGVKGVPRRNWMLAEGEHLLHLYHIWRTSGKPKRRQLNCITLMCSAVELMESGIRLKAVQASDLSSIKFENGTVEIPFLTVGDQTEPKLRNLIAYEQHQQSRDITYFTDYVKFMDSLINSSKDIEVLRHAGIIENYLGNDEVVAQMFNKMGHYVSIPSFCYSEICNSLNVYCKRKRNIWMAKLRREYFPSPWAFLSVLAAILLLLLTAAQTVFAVLSYTKQK